MVAAFEHEGSRCEIGARVACSSGAAQHLTFAALGLREEAYLTSLMYSRPEAWLSWHTSRPVDRPLKSLLHVVLLGLRGLVFVPPLAVFSRGPVARRRRKRAPAVAALVPLFGLLTPARLDAAGQHGAGAAAGRSRSTTFQEVYELSAIGAPNGITLEGVGVSQNLFFGVPLTKVITSATLGLRYTSRMPSDGTLLLWLNGTRLGTLRFTPGTDVQAEVTLPTDLLNTDNTLTLRLANCDGCGENQLPAIAIDARSTLGHRRLETPAAERSVAVADSVCSSDRAAPWQLPLVFRISPIPPRCRPPPSSPPGSACFRTCAVSGFQCVSAIFPKEMRWCSR